MSPRVRRRGPGGDRGSILIITLIVSVVLAVVVVALATYATTTLRFGQAVEQSADRLTAAHGGMDNALEALGRFDSECAFSLQAETSAGYTFPLGDDINGIEPVVNCKVVGGSITAVDQFAVMMTGRNGQTGDLLYVSGGGSSDQAVKVFEGPVYMAAPPSGSNHNAVADLTIKGGNLWYSNPGACPDPPSDPDPAVALDPNIQIVDGYGLRCIDTDWSTQFGAARKPPMAVPAAAAAGTTPLAAAPSGACTVWSPGRYTSAPAIANNSYNYFRSGVYVFDNVGNWTIGNAYVLAGRTAALEPGIPALKSNANDVPSFNADNPCALARATDAQDGAVFYMGGNSRISLSGNAALEVSGHDVPGGYRVSLQSLDAGDLSGVPASNLTGEQRVVDAAGGSNKQLSMRALVWSPNSALEFGQVANDAVAALTGGAVVSELSAGASAQANNFVIRVDSQPRTLNYVFTVTASNSGSTVVRAVLEYRTDGFYAVRTRRVVGITPE